MFVLLGVLIVGLIAFCALFAFVPDFVYLYCRCTDSFSAFSMSGSLLIVAFYLVEFLLIFYFAFKIHCSRAKLKYKIKEELCGLGVCSLLYKASLLLSILLDNC